MFTRLRPAVALFLLLPALGSLACAQNVIGNGSVVTGTISGKGSQSWTFYANIHDVISVGISAVGNTTNFVPEVQIINPDGTYGWAYGTLWATAIGINAPHTGTYTLTVFGHLADATTMGGFSLQLALAPEPFTPAPGQSGGPLSNGQNYTGSITRGDLNMWSFNGTAGQSYILSISEIGDNGFVPAMAVFDPTGLFIGPTSGTWHLNIAKAGATGKYTVVVYHSDKLDQTGNYLLTLAQSVVPFVTPDEGGVLVNDTTFVGTIVRGDLDIWKFNANWEDTVTVKMAVTGGSGFGVSDQLYDPYGVSVGSWSTTGSSSTPIHMSHTGTYYIVMYKHDTNDVTGTYSLSISGSTASPPPVAGKDHGLLATNQFCKNCPGKILPPGSPVSTGNPIATNDPISLSNGNLFEQVTDYSTAGANPLAFIRYYNSRDVIESSTYASTMGENWRSNYDRYLRIASPSVIAERPDGRMISFALSGSTWVSDTDVDATLTNSGDTWTLTDSDDTVETYTQSGGEATLDTIKLRNGYAQTLNYTGGQLIITDSYGRSLTLTYADGLLSTVSTPDSLVLTFGFTVTGEGSRLTTVAYNTSPVTSQTYLYETVDQPFALTGIIDEQGNRFATWSYDAKGRATSSQHAGGADLTSIAYDDTTGNRTVTGPLGIAEVYKFTMLQGLPKLTEIDRAANGSVAAATRLFTYDPNGYLATATDWDANSTQYTNDSHGLPTTTVEAYGSPVARTTTTVYDTTWVHLPHTIATPGLTTTFNYDAATGNLLTKVEADTTTQTVPYSTNGQSRTTTYTWTATGQLQSIQLPRTDVSAKTTYTYSGGTLTSITDPLKHSITVISSTGGGLPLTLTDPNGVLTTLSYDGRLWLHTKTVTISGGSLTTTWDHNAVGNLTKVTQPDGTFLSYVYDPAHRLTSITNALGESLPLALDAAGNVTQELWQDAANVTQRQHTATYDALGRKLTDVGGMNQTTSLAYDSQGNLKGITDPLSNPTGQAFDALNRLQTVTDALTHTTGYAYDAHDRPLSVTDPNGHTTSYTYDGFGNTIEVSSPDTGATIYYYNPDGDITKRRDAAAAITNFTFDAGDRLLTRTYPADATLNVAFTYDQTGHGKGIGRLTSVTDQAGSLSRSYDESGNITSNARTISGKVYTTGYSYYGQRTLQTITYPGSSWIATYARDAAGQVTGVTTMRPGQRPANLVTGVTHKPFGPVASLTWGNGVTGSRTFDQDYRLTNLTDKAAAALQNLGYGYDADDNVKTITDAVTSGNSQTLGYDVLNRLTAAQGNYGSLSYQYDNNGNRTYAGTTKYTIAATSNRLAAIGSTTIGYTGTGNIKTIGTSATLTYNQANQLATATAGGSSGTYGYDAFGNRLTVQPPTAPLQVYEYDQTGNLLTETDNNIETDYLYLDGTPIATIMPSTAAVRYIHTERLGTPQLVTSASKATVWGATYQPFGATLPSGSIIQNLRLPGQYADNTGFSHNGARDYNPAMGRYLESDPIGLGGGLNTYAYARSNPMAFVDPTGFDGINPDGTLHVTVYLNSASPGLGVGGVFNRSTVANALNTFGDVTADVSFTALFSPATFELAPALTTLAVCSKVAAAIIEPSAEELAEQGEDVLRDKVLGDKWSNVFQVVYPILKPSQAH